VKGFSLVGSHRFRWAIPFGLFIVTFLAVAATLSDYGVTWDEPPYFHAADLHIQWLQGFGNDALDGNPGKSLQDERIKAAWRWDPYHVPHPPLSRIVSGAAKVAAPPWVDIFAAYRLGPALFFALLVTLMYLWIAALFDRATAIVASLGLLVTPNLFGFAHIAVTDIPLTAMWFLTVFCFWRGLKSWPWSVVLGAVWGLALATKFPALLIPIPLFLWAHIYHRQAYANNVITMLFISPVVMVLCQPYLWHQPGLRILEFLFEGLSRGYRPETNYTIFFWGDLFYTNQLPWYYPFFIVGVTTPETILIFALLGSVCLPWLHDQKPTIVLFLINTGFIIALGLLPGAVLHDGVRQLMSALPFLVALAACGFYVLVARLKEKCTNWPSVQPIKQLPHKITAAVALLALFTPAVDTYLSHPFQLSYYNRLVGGIHGAYVRGLEVTYFMEAFTPEFLRNLDATLPLNATINASVAKFMFEYYKNHGRLRSDLKFTDKPPFDYYLLLNRQSVLSPAERALFRTVNPVVSVELAGVPLAAAFKIEKLD